MDRNQFPKGFVPFGGGRYQCPGKTFAIMEMHLFVVMVLTMFEMEMKDPFPSEVSQCFINIRREVHVSETGMIIKSQHLRSVTTPRGKDWLRRHRLAHYNNAPLCCCVCRYVVPDSHARHHSSCYQLQSKVQKEVARIAMKFVFELNNHTSFEFLSLIVM